jgi:hypothetical protein
MVYTSPFAWHAFARVWDMVFLPTVNYPCFLIQIYYITNSLQFVQVMVISRNKLFSISNQCYGPVCGHGVVDQASDTVYTSPCARCARPQVWDTVFLPIELCLSYSTIKQCNNIDILGRNSLAIH